MKKWAKLINEMNIITK